MKLNSRVYLIITLFILRAAVISTAADIPRVMRYFPDGRDIVCFNGTNRYTRALYGTHTRFRVETSDRPIFAVYDGADSYNFRFWLEYDGKTARLDSTSWCEARYQGGRRTYLVKDKRWGNAQLEIYVMASFFGEGALWQFKPSGFNGKVTLHVKRCHTSARQWVRDGDLGSDDASSFDPAPGEPDLIIQSWDAGEESYLSYENNSTLRVLSLTEGRSLFEKEESARLALINTVEINTPDPFFNTLGSSLLAAADGIWDGDTFLHGAIGWRTQLNGWRGAYVGDVVGWNDRAISHFDAYAASMITDTPPVLPQPQQDSSLHLARGLEKLGTPIFSDGYMCRSPRRTDFAHHYDMNLNYMDELFWHFCYDADTTYLRKMWPKIKLHLAWEKRNFDPDGDHLYDAYCCIWASDALYYNGGDVTHSSAYNYRTNLLSARIAEILGEDPEPYRREAEAILAAMNEILWMKDLGYWAEFKDNMGLKRLHKSAALWSVYTPIDCDAGSPEQFWAATRYVDRSIPHIPVKYDYDYAALSALGIKLPPPDKDLFTLSTTDWLPYVWSTNNVAHEEVANMALAYLQAGRNDSGFKLLKADLLDEMYLGGSPGNFGQISYYDKARTEAYRDFADNIGISSRAIVNGLFGIIPDALFGRCLIKPAFPDDWNEVSIKTPYLSYSFHREGPLDIYEIEQHFQQPLSIIVRTNAGGGAYFDVAGNTDTRQTITVDRRKLPHALNHKDIKPEKDLSTNKHYLARMGLGKITRRTASHSRTVDISPFFNSNADDIFNNEYLSPRWPYTTLSMPTQGMGNWCTPLQKDTIDDSGLRKKVVNGVFDTGKGLVFRTPSEGPNIVYTSLWDNFPESVTIPLDGKARFAWLLMCGSTNSMQSRIDNGIIKVTYSDGSSDEMPLHNPINWCPVQQDYYTDDHAFWTASIHPYRLLFKDGSLTRSVNIDFLPLAKNDGFALDNIKKTDRIIPSGAAQVLKMPLKRGKTLSSLTLTSLSNDVVIGLMAITLEK